MNKVILMGRLTKDVEMRYTANNNTAVASFTLAVNRKYKQEGQPDADFVNIVAWDKGAEFCGKYFKKGQQVGIIGRLQIRTWDDTEGKKHWVTEVVAEENYFADSKKEDGQGNPQTQQPAQQPPAGNQQGQQQQSTPPQQAPAPAGKMPWEV